MPAELLSYQTLWTVTTVADELAISVAAAGNEAAVLNLVPVNDWSAHGIDLARSWSGDELNMYDRTRAHPENYPGP